MVKMKDQIIHAYDDFVIIFVNYAGKKRLALTAKQAKQKKAMKLLGIWADGVYWNDDFGQLQVDIH